MGEMMKEEKLSKYLVWSFGLSLITHRISTAIGSVFFVIGILCFLYLAYLKSKCGSSLLCDTDAAYISYYKMIGIMLLTMFPSIIFSYNPLESAKYFCDIWIYRLVPLFAITLFAKNYQVIEKVIVGFFAAEAVECLLVIYQTVMGITNRPGGFGNHPMHLAGILAMVIPVIIVVVMDKNFSAKLRTVCMCLLPVLLVGAIAGRSRGLWLTLLLVLPFVGYKYLLENKKYLMVALGIFVVLLGVFWTTPKLKNRVASITNVTTNKSNIGRLSVWESSINMIKDHPVTGVGLRQFKKQYDQKYDLKRVKFNLPHSHNNFLQIFSEAGVIGFLGYLFFTVFVLCSNFIDWIKNKNPYSLMMFALWAGFTGFGFIDATIYGSSASKTIWLMTGFLLALKVLKNNPSKNLR